MDLKLIEYLNILSLGFDENNNLIMINNPFRVRFGNIKNFSLFKNKFSFEICSIDSEKTINYTPIDFCLDSDICFFSFVKFQNTDGSLSYFEIKSLIYEVCVDNIKKMIFFEEVTDKVILDSIKPKYLSILESYDELKIENKKLLEIKQKAQNQAVKMSILNRIGIKIRKTINIEEIIEAAIKELKVLFGAFKIYYATYEGEYNFRIRNILSLEYLKEKDNVYSISRQDYAKLLQRRYILSSVLKSQELSVEIFPVNYYQLIIPLYHKTELLGVIVSYSKKKPLLFEQDDLIVSISTQLASGIIQAELFEKLKNTNLELNNALDELKETQLQLINSEKMASLGQLVAGVAHEINTPLASINSNTSLRFKILEKIESGKSIENYLTNIKKMNELDNEAIRRISNIVKSLKKFVRLDEAEVQLVDINKEIDLTLELIHHEIKNKIEIEKKYSDLPLIKCYPNMLNQVFMNILMNAVQSIENKGKIVISTIIEGKNLNIKIKDNGKGIKKDIQDKIFQIGFTTKPYGLGTGLGLAISKKIINKHRGNISFTSIEKEGTEFSINIPIDL